MGEPRSTDSEGCWYGPPWKNEGLDRLALVLSHDLRNPLNIAMGELELAREAYDDEHLETVAQALSRMEAMVEDVLTLAREGTAGDEVAPVNLSEVVEDAWGTVVTNESTLVCETDRTIRAHHGRLQQLLENLVRNAIEHGGEDVTVTVGDLDDGFFLADDGPGISPRVREQMLDVGYSTVDGGTGFGLAIVREIAEAHGWTFDVRDGGERGARFEFVVDGDD